MSSVKALKPERTRNLESVLLRQIAAIGQCRLAEHYGISESQFSRTKMERVEEVAEFLSLLGLDLWPADMGAPDPDVYKACSVLASRFLADNGHDITEPLGRRYGMDCA